MTVTQFFLLKNVEQILLPNLSKNRKIYALLTSLLFVFTSVPSQVIISEVFPNGTFELKNVGNDTADISTYWICNFPNYRALNILTIDCGSLKLAAGGEVVFSEPGLYQTNDSELALYTNGSFTSATGLISYLQWGSSTHERSGLAIGKGLWIMGEAVSAFSASQSLQYDGDGFSAADWIVNSSPNACDIISCEAMGGTITGGPFSFCVGDGKADTIMAGSISLTGNTGANSQWVVTDANGSEILGLPGMPSQVNFDGAGAGLCLIWYLSYEDGLTGLAMGNTLSQLVGCYSFSDSIPVNRIQPMGGTITGGPFSFCVGDGKADTIMAGSISLSGNTGANSQWVVTDANGSEILGLPGMPSQVNFDGAGAGQCLIWHLSYEDGLTGLAMGDTISQLQGCYQLSNSIRVERFSDGEICATPCEVMGGTITGGPFSFCVGDGKADTIMAGSISLTGNTGANSQWVVTDANGSEILGLPGMPSQVNFDGAGAGQCLIWHLSYEDGLTGLAMGDTISQLQGCYQLSNSIRVERFSDGEICATPCEVMGGTITGGPFSFCVGDGKADTIMAGSISLTGNTGANSQWVVTDVNGSEILGLPGMPSQVNFDDAGAGLCLIWHLSYEDGLTGLAMGNTLSQLVGCYSFSDSIPVNRIQPMGGTITGGPFSFCVGDGKADTIMAGSISLSGNTGANSQWVVTDANGSEILGLPGMPSQVNFDGAGAGQCLIWHLSYEDGLTGLAMGDTISQLQGCYQLSNSIRVERFSDGEICATPCEVMGGTITGGPFSFCVGDGKADTIMAGSISLTGNTGANSQWVVTDGNGKEILGMPGMPSQVNFDGAGAGQCLIWHLSYEDGLTGLTVGDTLSQLVGCYQLSNSIEVNRFSDGEICAVEEICSVPAEIVVEVLSPRKIRLDWEDVPNAINYLIEIRFKGQTRIVGKGTIRFSRVQIFAPSGRDYEFRLKTLCNGGSESEFTNWIEFSTPPKDGFISSGSRNADGFKADLEILENQPATIQIYPNPVSDLLVIQYFAGKIPAKLTVFHVSGKRVLQKDLAAGESFHSLNVDNLNDGLYFMTIRERGKARITQRFVKGIK